MIPAKLAKFLSENKVKFEEVEHRTVYTGLDKAATLKVKPKLIAKTLVLKDGKNLLVAVLAANRNLNKEKFKKATKTKNPDFVSEKLMKARFKGYQIGAVPPFGGLFQLPSFVDSGLVKLKVPSTPEGEKMIYVSAGTYEDSLKISPKVLEKLGAVKADFSQPKKISKKLSLPKKVAKKKTKKKNPPRRRMRR